MIRVFDENKNEIFATDDPAEFRAYLRRENLGKSFVWMKPQDARAKKALGGRSRVKISLA